ncbi:D42E1 reductase, partial [Polypterus senegalus]
MATCEVQLHQSVCQLQQQEDYQLKGSSVGHPGLNSGVGAKHRSSGVVPHQSNAFDCILRSHSAPGGRKVAKALVTGGAGYLGQHLGCTLVREGISVILLDLQKPKWDIPEGANFIQGDIRDYKTVYKASEDVDCVFHVASYGMSGPDQLKKQQIESINVGGTRNIIEVCIEKNIPRLIYTSSVCVVFKGNPIDLGDEDSVPYIPLVEHCGFTGCQPLCNHVFRFTRFIQNFLFQHVDHYSKTKAIADQMVIAANGTPMKGGTVLRTCVLRPPGIYGPEERRHLQRVAFYIEWRLFSFTFGNRQSRINWVHVDNLVRAHLLAAEALTPRKGYIAFDKLGYRRPFIHLPFSLVYAVATVSEHLHLALRPVFEVPLLFTRNEARTIAVTHTFRIDKAQKQLGFYPTKYSLASCIENYKRRPHGPGDVLICLKLFVLLGALFILFHFYSSSC